jgi:hypothetical protein
VYISHGRKTFALSDPMCPQVKVSNFVKTKLDQLVAGVTPPAEIKGDKL